MSSVTTTNTSVDPSDEPKVGFPAPVEEGFLRPWLRIPAGVFVTMPVTADSEAAAWWRSLAANAGSIAAWYEQRTPAGGAR